MAKEKTPELSVVRRRLKKTRDGVVTANKAEKTITVAITRPVMHARYRKYINKTKKYLVHDEKNECQVGDTVRIVETRPLSKMKRWRVQNIVTKAV